LRGLQRAFIRHDSEKDKLILEERARCQELVRQSTRLKEVIEAIKDKHADEKAQLEDRIDREKAKVDKCKVYC
jgi:vacuolar-type H+-ATPase subunit I/STV1